MTASARLAVGRMAMWAVVILQQRRNLRIDNENDVTAVTAVTAIWSAEWLELFAMDRSTAVAAIAAANVEDYAIYKVGHAVLLSTLEAKQRASPIRTRPLEVECARSLFRDLGGC
jgi:hypothetical protein